MKRIKAECLEQMIHFQLKDGLPMEDRKKQVRQEYESNKGNMDRCGTQYKILEEIDQPDGSLTVKVKRQNNYHPIGNYLD